MALYLEVIGHDGDCGEGIVQEASPISGPTWHCDQSTIRI